MARFAIVSVFLGLALAGCAAIVAQVEPSHVFHPYVTDKSPPFQVVDRRPEAGRSSRKIDQGAWSFVWFYGDAQFSPNPVQVVADRFAVAFPRAGPESVLVITELEISHQLSDIRPFGPQCSQLIIDCFFKEAMEDVAKQNVDVVSATLSGTFAKASFQATYRSESRNAGQEAAALSEARQEARVLSTLQNVIDGAVKNIRERLNPSTPSTTDQDRATLPNLPRPWYMPTPSQIDRKSH